jgi:hypothetical protein
VPDAARPRRPKSRFRLIAVAIILTYATGTGAAAAVSGDLPILWGAVGALAGSIQALVLTAAWLHSGVLRSRFPRW